LLPYKHRNYQYIYRNMYKGHSTSRQPEQNETERYKNNS